MRLSEYTDYTLRVLMYCARTASAWSRSANWPNSTACRKTT
jgi:DNA-binding IscR family transcriptional regulator